MSKLLLLTEGLHDVLPTPTTLLTLGVKQFQRLTLEVENQDADQTLTVEIWRRASAGGPFALSQEAMLQNIGPGEARCIDYDVAGTVDVQLRATASGIGLTCRTAGTLVESLA